MTMKMGVLVELNKIIDECNHQLMLQTDKSYEYSYNVSIIADVFEIDLYIKSTSKYLNELTLGTYKYFVISTLGVTDSKALELFYNFEMSNWEALHQENTKYANMNSTELAKCFLSEVEYMLDRTSWDRLMRTQWLYINAFSYIHHNEGFTFNTKNRSKNDIIPEYVYDYDNVRCVHETDIKNWMLNTPMERDTLYIFKHIELTDDDYIQLATNLRNSNSSLVYLADNFELRDDVVANIVNSPLISCVKYASYITTNNKKLLLISGLISSENGFSVDASDCDAIVSTWLPSVGHYEMKIPEDKDEFADFVDSCNEADIWLNNVGDFSGEWVAFNNLETVMGGCTHDGIDYYYIKEGKTYYV